MQTLKRSATRLQLFNALCCTLREEQRLSRRHLFTCALKLFAVVVYQIYKEFF